MCISLHVIGCAVVQLQKLRDPAADDAEPGVAEKVRYIYIHIYIYI